MSPEVIGQPPGPAVAGHRSPSTLPPSRERELVARAVDDPDAFAELYRHYLPRIHAFAWRRTGDTALAEDICSATFEATLRSLPKFRWRRNGFAPWLYRIASNQVVAHWRREGRATTERGQRALAELHRPVDDTDPDELANRDRGAALDPDGEVRAALDRLTPRYQQALALRYLADLDHGQAAAAMGLAKPAFAVVLSRAATALRRELVAGREEAS